MPDLWVLQIRYDDVYQLFHEPYIVLFSSRSFKSLHRSLANFRLQFDKSRRQLLSDRVHECSGDSTAGLDEAVLFAVHTS